MLNNTNRYEPGHIGDFLGFVLLFSEMYRRKGRQVCEPSLLCFSPSIIITSRITFEVNQGILI